MSDYIKREDVVNLGVMMQTHLWTREQTYNAIFCLPSADVAPVRHGYWIKISPAGIYECSECRKNVMTEDIDAYEWCHGCGAKMDEEETKE